MRRFLIGLTLVVLLAVSIGVGVLLAEWPSLRHFVLPGRAPTDS